MTSATETHEHDQAADMMAARHVALNLMVRILDQKQALDHALERHDGFLALPPHDRGFCRMMISTTLRRLGQIDHLIARAEHRSASKPPLLQHILRLGVTQITFMAVADHAAVDTSVRLAEHYDLHKQKGFVNGLLRNLLREGQSWAIKQDAGRLNTPEWLLKTWISDYGLREAATIANANLNEAPLDITISAPDDLTHFEDIFAAKHIAGTTLRTHNEGPVHMREGFDDGKWWVQDASAALPARLLGDIKGKTVLDICAAPGGKTMQLAAQGAQVIAMDRSAKRMQRLSENITRVGLDHDVRTEVADAAVWQAKEPIPFILVDAPCSATGTIRRNPDVLHHKSEKDLERLTNIQSRILDNAFAQLAVGGTLIYCTCSLQKSEGEDQIAAFFARTPNAMRLRIEAKEIGGLDDAINDMGEARIFPQHNEEIGGMDGFFIARIQKQV